MRKHNRKEKKRKEKKKVSLQGGKRVFIRFMKVDIFEHGLRHAAIFSCEDKLQGGSWK